MMDRQDEPFGKWQINFGMLRRHQRNAFAANVLAKAHNQLVVLVIFFESDICRMLKPTPTSNNSIMCSLGSQSKGEVQSHPPGTILIRETE
jgi:hypothetical protein